MQENARLRKALRDIVELLHGVECYEWPFDPAEEPEAAVQLMEAADRIHGLALRHTLNLEADPDRLERVRRVKADE